VGPCPTPAVSGERRYGVRHRCRARAGGPDRRGSAGPAGTLARL